MATSNSQNFSQTRNEVIKDALMLLGVVNAEEQPNGATIAFASRTLNSLIKAWNARGFKLWTYGEGVIVFNAETASYTLGLISGTETAFKSSGLITTTFGADEALGQTSITVVDSTGMAASDVCLMVLDDSTLHTTTISSITNATTIVIANALPSAASEDNAIFTYTPSTDVLPKIKDIGDVYVRKFADSTDIKLKRINRSEYKGIHEKDATGMPTMYYIDNQLADPIIYFWPVLSDLSYSVRFTYKKSLDDMDSSSDDFDFPQEWLHCLKYNLAVHIAPYVNKEVKLKVIAPIAAEALRDARGFDSPGTSFYFRPRKR